VAPAATVRAKISNVETISDKLPFLSGLGCEDNFFFRKNTFLTIQLWFQFGFGYRTLKPGIFSHPTIKTVQI